MAKKSTSFFGALLLTSVLALPGLSRAAVEVRSCRVVHGTTEKSQTPLLDWFQKSKSNVMPDQIEPLSEELKSYLSQHRGERILIFTDATSPDLKKETSPRVWTNFRRPITPQTSGVVTVMNVIRSEIAKYGVDVRFVTPEEFKYHHQISYQNVVAAMPTKAELDRIVNEKKIMAVHIMVEGSVGKAAKAYLEKRHIPYTTAYHTDFPQYVFGAVKFYAEKFIGKKYTEKLMSWLQVPERKEALSELVLNNLAKFHKHSEGIMVPTESMLNSLVEKGFPLEDVRQWSHGVDLAKFPVNLDPKIEWYEQKAIEAGLIPAGGHLKSPVMLFVGRVGDEKNIEFFLDLPVEGTKVVVGDGPLLPSMKANPKYKDVLFFGRQPHESVPQFMANANVFPFASLSETFGLVNLEAAAAGTPVVTFDYLKEIIASPSVGRTVPLSGNREVDLQNFANATREALQLDRQGVRAYAENWSWNKSIVEMLAYLHFLTPAERERLQP